MAASDSSSDLKLPPLKLAPLKTPERRKPAAPVKPAVEPLGPDETDHAGAATPVPMVEAAPEALAVPPPLPALLVPPPLPVALPPLPRVVTPPPRSAPAAPEKSSEASDFEPWSAFSMAPRPRPGAETPETPETAEAAEVAVRPPPLPPPPAQTEYSVGALAAQPTPVLRENTQVGPYILKQLIGEGGMGLVYRAEDTVLKRAVALKVMKPEVAADKRAWMLFLKEAQATASLKDSRIATIYQAGEHHKQFYLAMELLTGESLEARLKRGPMSISQALWVVREAALGLAVAHNAGFVHRDIKPANLWLETSDPALPRSDVMQKYRPEEVGREPRYARVKILDFGLVHLDQDSDGRRRTTSVVGTPAYMAPEQATGNEANARSDIFSLGVVLFRLLTGRLPFEGDTSMEMLTALATKAAPPVSQFNPKAPPPLVELVQRMLSRDPLGRPGSASDVARLIEGIEKFALVPAEQPRKRKRTLLIAAAAVAAAVTAFVGWRLILHDSGSKNSLALVGGLPTDRVLEPREAAGAIGDRVTVEFVVGDWRILEDLYYLYERQPPAGDSTVFRVVLPPHVVGQLRKRGAHWPEAAEGATLRLHGTVTREGRFAELLVSDLEQFDKILYKEKPSVGAARNGKKEPMPGIGADLPPTEGPKRRAPDANVGKDLTDSLEKATRDLLKPFKGNVGASKEVMPDDKDKPSTGKPKP